MKCEDEILEIPKVARRTGDGGLAALFIGYGNPLRSDDGIGQAVVGRLARLHDTADESWDVAVPRDGKFAGGNRGGGAPSRLPDAFLPGDGGGCEFLCVHQLMPELAADICRARRVVFVDASVDLRPGQVRIRRVMPEAGGELSLLAHHVSPESLMAFAEALYGARPRAWMVEVGIANRGMGNRLTPAVCVALARVSHLLSRRIIRWTSRAEFPGP